MHFMVSPTSPLTMRLSPRTMVKVAPKLADKDLTITQSHQGEDDFTNLSDTNRYAEPAKHVKHANSLTNPAVGVCVDLQ